MLLLSSLGNLLGSGGAPDPQNAVVRLELIALGHR